MNDVHGSLRAAAGENVPGYAALPTIQRSLRDHAPAALLVAVYAGVIYATELTLGLRRPLGNVGLHDVYLLCLAGTLYFVILLVRLRGRVRDVHGRWVRAGGWRLAAVEFRERVLTRERVSSFVVMTVITLLLLRAYASWKPLIPQIQPFAWDPALLQLDRRLHLGTDPWRLLHPFVGHASATFVIDFLYALWVPLNFFILFWVAWERSPAERARYLLGYALIWIVLGTIAATPLASAGPCYYGRIVPGPDPFEPLMTYLNQVDARFGLVARTVQEGLWRSYEARAVLPVNGISAMPSVHVGVAALYLLAGWRAGAWARTLLAGYATVILVGSVHLGWHYAVDGYVSVLAVFAIWVAADAVTRRRFSGCARRDLKRASGADR